MNRKNKNKKSNKPRPNPPQNVEENVIQSSEEPVLEKQSDVILEERVPEVVSEVFSDVKEEESPTKPKRKNKKKKHEKGDVEEEIQSKNDVKSETSSKEIKKEDKDEELPEEPSAPASNRKKKNKKPEKAADTVVHDTLQSEGKVTEAPKEVVASPALEEEPKTEQETKSSKKKNKKKKNRNDSEKSDKEEVPICTSAFQALLAPKDESMNESKIEDKKEPMKDFTSQDMVKDESNVCKDTQSSTNISLISDEFKEEIQKDGKNKKKNKKDKKQPIKVDESETSTPEPKSADNVEETPLKTEKVETTEEDSNKSKAKIVKPVDKHRKGPKGAEIPAESLQIVTDIIVEQAKPDTSVKDNKAQDIFTEKSASEGNVSDNIQPICDIEPEKKIEIELEVPVKTDIPQKENVIQEETISPNENLGATGKKKKKGPKLPNPEVVGDNVAKVEKLEPIQETAKDVCGENTGSLSTLPISTEIKNVVSPASEYIQVTILEQIPQMREDPKKLEECISPAEEIPELQSIENLLFTDVKPSKKRKKSPKLPPKQECKDVDKSESKTPETTLEPTNSGIVSDNTETDKLKEKTNLSLPVLSRDIEISCLSTDESEGLICDVPDSIRHPRASSQQLTDDNNNMVIQDVTTPQGMKEFIPIETGTLLSECLREQEKDIQCQQPSSITLTELPKPTCSKEGLKGSNKCELLTPIFNEPPNYVQQEKSDLKSKVIEVNKDMEELRLSIEKSLAELTSMENTEDMLEKNTQIQLEIVAEAKKTVEVLKEELLKQPLEVIDMANIESTEDDSQTSSEPTTEVLVITPSTADVEIATPEADVIPFPPPVCPARKDNKGKGKSKKKGKHEHDQAVSTSTTSTTPATTSTASEGTDNKEASKSEKKSEEQDPPKSEKPAEEGKQQSTGVKATDDDVLSEGSLGSGSIEMVQDFEPIENFEDALTSSVDDVNKTFELIVKENESSDRKNIADTQRQTGKTPEINIVAPSEETAKDKKDNTGKDKTDEKVHPVSQPKNLIGHPDIPVQSNKTDYKKEKDKTPNAKQAKVKIKDSEEVEPITNKQSKESQTENKRRLKFLKDKTMTESVSCVTKDDEEYVYKYSFRRVFLPNLCHVCKKDLRHARLPCAYCNLVFYCSHKHKDEDWPLHQALCFAVSTIGHLKNQKHIYADSQKVTGQNYRLLRMQMIISCEKILKRRLVAWEQEILLYPRMCADVECREWRQGKLMDCEGCGQISYCADNPSHLPKSHQRWCKSYFLYQKLVHHQQTKGRLEPKLPTKVITEPGQIQEKLNEVLASMYEEKIDLSDIQYAALTQLATAPLTAAYCLQLYNSQFNASYANGLNKRAWFTIHVVGAELQFEADSLSKWEIFFLHLRPDVQRLRVVLVGKDLNPSELPLDLLGNVKVCSNCSENNRRVDFYFEDKKTYQDYYCNNDYITPDLVCAFNPSIERSSIFNGRDFWPGTINCILKHKVPFIVTGHTLDELARDLSRIQECATAQYIVISEPKINSFASLRPDRNFISDDEMPLLFKNYCFMIISGAF